MTISKALLYVAFSFDDRLSTLSLPSTERVKGTTLHVDASEEELIISDLDPDTQYTFTVLAINSIGNDSLQVI